MENSCGLIAGSSFCDDRGYLRFVNDFDPVKCGVRRFYQVENHTQGFVRAFHGHLNEAKYVYVAKGSALVIATKIEENAEEDYVERYLSRKFTKFTLTAQIPKVLYVPAGYANGFKTLEQDTIVMFFSTSTLEDSKGDDYRFDWNNLGADIWMENYR